jgi:hypothetical protein
MANRVTRMRSESRAFIRRSMALVAGSLVLTGCAAGRVPTTVAGAPTSAPVERLAPGNWHAREGVLVQRKWGVEIIGVRRMSSGYMLRLSYRVVDAEKARPLFDKKVRPFVIDEVTGARLAVPAMENIGELRQTGAPVDDRDYFIIFGNPEKLVKSGGRVSIVLGDMRIDGFTVD